MRAYRIRTCKHFMDKIDEQSVVDNSRHPVNRFSQPFGGVHPVQMKIDNVVPAVCHEERPVFLPDFRRIPGLFEFFQRVFVGEGYNFHRQREFSQLFHPFGGIRDDNDLSRKGSDDFLPQQRASAALAPTNCFSINCFSCIPFNRPPAQILAASIRQKSGLYKMQQAAAAPGTVPGTAARERS